MRIFYLCPDVEFPSGGIKRLYTHVEVLSKNGFDAYIMHTNKGFKPAWFLAQAPVVYSSDSPAVGPDDILVIPEGFPAVLKQFASSPIKKVVIALSLAYIFETMPLGENWKHYGVNWVMTNNKTTKEFIQWSMSIENVHIIESSIDHELFYYKPGKKTPQIVYIKRKDTLSPIVEKILTSRNIPSGDLNFIPIENLNIQDYARLLRDSTIYLTTSISEGFPRPILEAMACGCVCIGFDGIGGRDFIIDSGSDQNFILAETMNFFDLAKKLEEIVPKLRTNDSQIEKIRQNALATAAKFSPDLEAESVLRFWRAFIEAQS